MTDVKEHPKVVEIHIDHKLYKVAPGMLTGAQLRAIPSPPISEAYDLWLEQPGDDEKIGDQQSVTLENGMQFYSASREINPGADIDAVA